MKSMVSRFIPWNIPVSIMLGAVSLMAAAADLSRFPLEPRFELPPGDENEPVPLRWAGSRVLVPVSINGKDAGWFQIGTADRESFIDAKVAENLRLPEIPEFGSITEDLQAFGLKPGRLGATSYYRVDTLRCGPAVATDARFWPKDLDRQENDPTTAPLEDSEWNPECPVSGIIGWDLLRTLPFLLDEPGLQLIWQSQAIPPDGAVSVPMTERHGYLYVQTTLGDGCKTLAQVNATGSYEVAITREFVKLHQDQIWQGPRFRQQSSRIPAVPDIDDDALPVDFLKWAQPTIGCWLDVECGGLKLNLPAMAVARTMIPHADAQLGYGLLRRAQVLFDGPGKALWIKPSKTSPEVTLAGSDRPAPSPSLLAEALFSTVIMNDSVAVKMLIADGAAFSQDVPGFTPLQVACRRRSRDVAMALIESGTQVEPPMDHGITPLLSACEIGDVEMIRLLLKKGANANRADGQVTPLVLAALSGSTAAVNALEGKVVFPTKPRGRVEPALDAAMEGNFPLFRKWIAGYPKEATANLDWSGILETLLMSGSQDGLQWLIETRGEGLAKRKAVLPPLIAAIFPTRLEKTDAVRERMVNTLLAAGADPNAACKGVTPLLLAARHGNTTIVERLLAAGARISSKDYKQRNVLMRAALANQPVEMVALLLKAGVDPNEVDSGSECTPLNLYAMHGNVEACRILLEAGANPDGDPMMMFSSPLMWAVGFKSIADDESMKRLIELLLEHGAKVRGLEGGSEQGMSLHPVISARRASLVKLVATAHSPPFEPDSSYAGSCLKTACMTADPATVRAVLDLGINPSTPDETGFSPLANAAGAGMVANMAVLLEHGVSPDDAGPLGVPPIWMAAANGQTRVVRFLLAAGARTDTAHPVRKTTALEAARSRRDRTIISLLEKER